MGTRGFILWLGVAAGGAGFLLGQRHERAELAALQRQVATLAEAVQQKEAPPGAAMLQQLLAAPSAPAPAPVAAPTPVPTAPAPPPPSEEDAAAAAADRFTREAVEPGWSRGAEAALREGIAGRGLDGRALRSVQCRQRTCRVELAAGADEGRRFLEEALRPGPGALWPGGVRVMPGDDASDGQPTLLAYLDRE